MYSMTVLLKGIPLSRGIVHSIGWELAGSDSVHAVDSELSLSNRGPISIPCFFARSAQVGARSKFHARVL